MQVLGLHPRPDESETLGVGLATCISAAPPGESEAHSGLKSAALTQLPLI